MHAWISFAPPLEALYRLAEQTKARKLSNAGLNPNTASRHTGAVASATKTAKPDNRATSGRSSSNS